MCIVHSDNRPIIAHHYVLVDKCDFVPRVYYKVYTFSEFIYNNGHFRELYRFADAGYLYFAVSEEAEIE